MTSPASPAGTPTWASFDLEQWQSEWEHAVDINLADSGVEPSVSVIPRRLRSPLTR